VAGKVIARRLLGDYQYYRILRVDRDAAKPPAPAGVFVRRLERLDPLMASPHSEVAELASYRGDQAACFVAEEAGTVVAACWYWFGETYQRRNFWPLRPGEAKLVQITSAAARRGRGIAEALIRTSTVEMLDAGFEALYARVWHSHGASLRAFEKAGWRDHASVIEAQPFGRRVRFVWWK
jgi:ribosomal protein S18 acetylase RimI-like enzyme